MLTFSLYILINAKHLEIRKHIQGKADLHLVTLTKLPAEDNDMTSNQGESGS